MRIAIEGLIGVGKSTLCYLLKDYLQQKNMDSLVIEEPLTSNPYLDDFYNDPHRWAFTMQIDLLCQRVKRIRKSLKEDTITFYDRHLWGDKAFAFTAKEKGYMTEDEYETYMRVFNSVVTEELVPTKVVYLKADLDVVMNRIKNRGRSCEMDMEMNYLSTLDQSYLKVLGETNFSIEIPYDNWLSAESIWQRIV